MRRGSKINRVLDLWLGIPLLNLLACFRRVRRKPAKMERIGVICSPALGDTLLVSGVLGDLRRHFDSGTEIIFFCMKQNLAAAEIVGGAQRLRLINLTRPLETIRHMRAERLDMLVDFSAWQRLTAFYSLMSGAKFTAGFETAGMYRSRGYDLTAVHRRDQHEMENFRALLKALDMVTGLPPKVEVPDGERPFADVADVVVFHPWASGQRSSLREWPEERWIQLASRLARPGTMFVVTGAASDLSRSEPLAATMRQKGLQAEAIAGTDGFRTLARILLHARVAVSVNTGVMHLAAIVGAPTVSLNGPTRGGRWGPVGLRALGVEAPGGGCGYLHLGFDFDGQATDCMERITVDQVQAAVELVCSMPVGVN